MYPSVVDILNRLDEYSRAERAQLAEAFLKSLDDIPEEEGGYEEAWEAEIERRVDDILSGIDPGKPAEQVMAEMRAKRR